MKIRFREGQMLLLGFNLASLALFGFLFAGSRNLEFLAYEGVILFFIGLVALTDSKVLYPKGLLWGLTLWAQLHLAGGGLFLGGQKLYEKILVPLVDAPYHVFRYDQMVHILGFGVCTILAWHLLMPHLRKPDAPPRGGLAFLLVLAGLGFGAVNEIVEFSSTVILARTGVGGYVNNALDLVADLIGALIALAWLRFRKRKVLVTAAVIDRDGKFLLAQRGPGDRLAGKWEFPGGKIEQGETPQDCLSREIREELGIVVQVGEFLCSSRFDYDHASVEIFAYRCKWVSGKLQQNAHQALQWLSPEELSEVDLAAADRPIARCLFGDSPERNKRA